MSRREEAEAIRDAGVPEDANVAAGLPSAAERHAAEEQDPKDEPRFPVARLTMEPVTDHPAYVVVGALAAADVPEDAELTRAEVDDLVKQYHERPQDPDQEG